MAYLVLFNKAGSSYRLICLLHAWSKVLDKLVTNKLVFRAQSQGFLQKNQFGFTPGKGTEDALNELKNMIRDSHESDKDSCLVMLDIKGAFSNLWWPSIYEALIKMKCPNNLFKFVRSFLSERKLLYRTATTSMVQEYNVRRAQTPDHYSGIW